MDFGNFLSIGALIAASTVLFTCFSQIKNLFWSIQRLWLGTAQLDKILSGAVYRYCLANMKPSRFRSKVYNGCIGYKLGDEKDNAFIFDILHQSTVVFWKGFRFVIMAPGPWKYDEVTGTYERTVNVYIPRFFWNTEKFIEDAVANYNTSKIKDKRFGITRFHGKHNAINLVVDETKKPDSMLVGVRALVREAQLGRAAIVGHNIESIVFDGMVSGKPFDWYAFNDEIMEVVERTRAWYNKKRWYKSKHIPWRRGIRAVGKAGSGKTLFFKCIAEDLDIPIFVFDIGSMNNEEFVKFWGEAVASSPCMILMEDFDAVFHGRENVVEYENKLSFDCLLNCIAGVENSDGVLLAISTNHPEHLDPALTRPGRLDDEVVMNNMNEKCRRIMVQRILGYEGQLLEDMVAKTDGMTAAELTNACNKIILEEKVEKKVA